MLKIRLEFKVYSFIQGYRSLWEVQGVWRKVWGLRVCDLGAQGLGV